MKGFPDERAPASLDFGLFATVTAHSRGTDPEPSREAAAQVNTRGTAKHQAALILAELLRHPEGLTADALDAALFANCTYAVAAKRLPELKAILRVERVEGEKRRTRAGIMATLWRAK